MKKFFAILLGVVLTVSAIALTSSCKKDIDNAKSLVNTAWLASTDGITYTLTFTSTTEFKIAGNGKEFKGIYIITGAKDSLAGSTISLTVDDWDDFDWDEATVTGKFETDTKLVLKGLVFTKGLK